MTKDALSLILARLKHARREKGYSQENVANELGISQASYANIESNEAKLSVERLIRISEILEKPVAYFLEPLSDPAGNHAAVPGQTNILPRDTRQLTPSDKGALENTLEEIRMQLVQLRHAFEKQG